MGVTASVEQDGKNRAQPDFGRYIDRRWGFGGRIVIWISDKVHTMTAVHFDEVLPSSIKCYLKEVTCSIHSLT